MGCHTQIYIQFHQTKLFMRILNTTGEPCLVPPPTLTLSHCWLLFEHDCQTSYAPSSQEFKLDCISLSYLLRRLWDCIKSRTKAKMYCIQCSPTAESTSPSTCHRKKLNWLAWLAVDTSMLFITYCLLSSWLGMTKIQLMEPCHLAHAIPHRSWILGEGEWW